MKGFLDFIRRQGAVGLAIGFILGGAVSKIVTAFVTDIVNPILGGLLGMAKGLENASIHIGNSQIMWGDFLNVTIDFLIVAAVVYFGVTLLKLDKWDKKEDK